MKTFLILTIILGSVWLSAGSKHSSHNLLRHRRSISESTRSHNEYDGFDRRGHRTGNNIGEAPQQNCVPGTRWKNGCNTCRCSSAGVSACTLMACTHSDSDNLAMFNTHHRQRITGHTVSRNSIQDYGDKHTRVRRSEGDRPQCVAGTSWKEDCNSCWCSPEGVAACTLMGCITLDKITTQVVTSDRQKRSSSSTSSARQQSSTPDDEKRCKHGTTWMQSCNRCRCFGGRAACTRMRCVENHVNTI